ncbi:mammalian cell entry protein [Rhodococcus pyridinivorans SB3094]|uniref:Mammalian cell entry protein n=1 Tax=Rhodococcus pyridinivorans SB3094 TaxID=1435356 RepID=V9XL05_9NOCA|nr:MULTISPECIES: MCE family protein [Rhodococcus]AHD22660.1 mammalian cell entry protein [Rhodococcus pyridinivorans SB3094]MCT7290376.1 MCE family protein [Rhodococcus sp. PAE-6]
MSTDTAPTTARRRPPLLVPVIIGAVVVLVLGALAVFVLPDLGKRTIHAEFASTSGLYEGDDVRVLGVSVGRISDIEPRDDLVQVTMKVDDGVEIPSDASAVVIAQSLVSARFVQLTPVYSGGPTIEDGATIPMQRTASPVEWDQIKTELMRLSEALGPEELDPQGSLGRFIDTAAENLEGNGQTVREALRELSDTMRTLSEGRTDLFSTIRNLQTFVSVLSSSNEQIVQFGGRLASVSDVLAQSSDQLGASLSELNIAVGDVQRFVQGNRAGLTESVERLADATEVLVRKRPEIERVLHSGPTSLANFYNIYKPAQGSLTGALAINNLANPVEWMCGSVAAAANATSERSEELCRQQLGPVLSSINANYLPLLVNPLAGVQAFPDDIVYTETWLEEASAGRGTAPEPSSSETASPVDGILGGLPSLQVPQDLGSLLQPGGVR